MFSPSFLHPQGEQRWKSLFGDRGVAYAPPGTGWMDRGPEQFHPGNGHAEIGKNWKMWKNVGKTTENVEKCGKNYGKCGKMWEKLQKIWKNVGKRMKKCGKN